MTTTTRDRTRTRMQWTLGLKAVAIFHRSGHPSTRHPCRDRRRRRRSVTKEGAVVIVNLSDWWACRPLMRRQPGAEWVASGSRVCPQSIPNGRERFSAEADQADRFVVERVRGRGQHVQRAGDRSRRSRLLGSYLSPVCSSRSPKSCMYWIWWVRPRCSWQAARAGSAPIASAVPGVVRSIEPAADRERELAMLA